MRSTGKFTKKGEEIFEGDYVIKNWGFCYSNGERRDNYQYHKVTVNNAHMMANGQIHDDGGAVIFCLGKAYNFWKGEEVIKLSEDDLKEFIDAGIKEDTMFYVKDEKIHKETFLL